MNFIFASIATLATLATGITLLALSLDLISPMLGAVGVTGSAFLAIVSSSFIEE